MADEKLRLVPREMFLTRGVGHHREKLASFEEAVRDAEIASFELKTFEADGKTLLHPARKSADEVASALCEAD